MLDEGEGRAADVVVRDEPGAGGWLERPGVAWALLAALALPLVALLVVTARTLTGHSPFLEGIAQEALYTRVAAAVLGQVPASSLLPTVVGLGVLALLPPDRSGVLPPAVRRAACVLAGLVAVVASAHVLLLGYLLTSSPETEGVAFVATGNELEQLGAPAAVAACTAAVAAVLARVLLPARAPAAVAHEEPDEVDDTPAEPDDSGDPPDEPEAPEPDEDPYARFRRPRG